MFGDVSSLKENFIKLSRLQIKKILKVERAKIFRLVIPDPPLSFPLPQKTSSYMCGDVGFTKKKKITTLARLQIEKISNVKGAAKVFWHAAPGFSSTPSSARRKGFIINVHGYIGDFLFK